MHKSREADPQSGMQSRRDRLILGLTWTLALAVAGSTLAEGQTYTETVLHNFTGKPDGSGPEFGSLVSDTAGNLYGTTIEGGANNDGCVFSINPSGKEKVIYSFTGNPDGKYPHEGVILDGAGNLYGATFDGGEFGFGTIFEVVIATGRETVLYSFMGQPDGANPDSVLTRDLAGNLYGTTFYGGTSNNGTVFEVSTSNQETVLHSFAGSPSDGAIGYAGLVRDSSGDLFGVTVDGGADNDGTVFELSSTNVETILHAFSGTPDGKFPHGDLVRDSSGNLYGTTLNGGSDGFGMVFKVSASGQEKPLYSFGPQPDGESPIAGVIRDSQGNLYGTTQFGGDFDFGSVYEITRAGQESVLYSFTGPPDGQGPIAGLFEDTKGDLYGTTELGGSSGVGVVFELSPQ
jgi:uncharacterized repeat protein (TIGR03803 family)